MGLYDTFATDPDLEKKGVFLDYGDFRIRIGYAGNSNKKYVAFSEKKFKPLRHAINTGAVDNERAGAILIEIYAETIIFDWETKRGEKEDGEPNWVQGIEARNGELLPFNKANVITTLKALPALFNDIKSQAESVASFRAVEMETDAGNSSSS